MSSDERSNKRKCHTREVKKLVSYKENEDEDTEMDVITDEEIDIPKSPTDELFLNFPVNKKYDLILADPPWTYKDNPNLVGQASSHYPCVSISDLISLKPHLDNICKKNCILAVWTTGPKMGDCLELIRGWGFIYKTVLFTWMKTYKSGNPISGMGFYTRSCCEFVLLATRGCCRSMRASKNISQMIEEPRTEHSAKPFIVGSRLIELFGEKDRLELFARQRREGYDFWGNEQFKQMSIDTFLKKKE